MRAVDGKTVPHDTKAPFVFADHTRSVWKGETGRPLELGVPVCVLEAQHSVYDTLYSLNCSVFRAKTIDVVFNPVQWREATAVP